MSMKIPGPPELLPGRPDAIIDLQTAEGAALAYAQWRYSDTQVRETGFVSVGPDLGPSGPANRTYEVVPRASRPAVHPRGVRHQWPDLRRASQLHLDADRHPGLLNSCSLRPGRIGHPRDRSGGGGA